MICKNCHSQVQDGSAVCPVCGAPIEGATLYEEVRDNARPTGSGTMYCSNCGAQISPSAVVCPYCGAPTMRTYSQAQGYTPKKAVKSNDMALVGFILSFFLPLIGLILSIVGLSRSKQADYNGSGKGMAIAGIVISSIILALAIIIAIVYVFFFASLSIGEAHYVL